MVRHSCGIIAQRDGITMCNKEIKERNNKVK